MSQEKLQIVKASDWQKSNPPDPDPVIKGLFDLGDKTCIIGGPKTYKTWFCLQLAVCICTGRPFLNFPASKPRRVLLIQCEVRDRRFHRRFKMALKTTGDDLDVTNLSIVNGRGKKLTCSDIIQAAKSCRAEVIILDPLYKLIEGDENSAKDMKVVLSMFDKIAEETGAAIVYTHHDAKGDAGKRNKRDRGAGSNVLARDYDCCITLSDHEQQGLQVADFLLRNDVEPPQCSLYWSEGVFSVSEMAPCVRRQSNRNPTTDQPSHIFFETLDRILTRSRWSNKQRVVEDLRSEAGVTKEKAIKVIEAALDSNRIISNHGKGLKRKQIIYALTQNDLDFALESIRCKQLQFPTGKQ